MVQRGAVQRLISAALELLATFGMGMFFPALIALASRERAGAGTSVGRIYAWNTLGAIVGALCAFTLLVPGIGAQRTLALALSLYVVALLCALAPRLARPRTGTARRCSPWP